MPTFGRGGAGNILTNTQLDEANVRLEQDLEANKKNVDLRPEDVMTRRAPADYASSGRGGAGNMVTPTALQTSPSADPSVRPPSPPPPTPSTGTSVPTTDFPAIPSHATRHPSSPAPMVGLTTGRGGAGNMAYASQFNKESEEAKKKQDEQEAGRVRERVVKDVEMGLQPPGRAVLGGEKAGRGW
ncbi:hypothetical protein P152DRAFT_454863 [Eremomyces bilateralis CBS 781.70]|uniref:Uncharacterized protein n=1 Tax=Eremomyces bilateralis CBS 781.70 TaxID=1392243 RepID=A0A6G1GEX0_9PEZI|nr:uncharacterized protein P152DRAFT_454863 [Eremomyces bilateralis CBS 781.70]KAF1816627.1 hypothetical protein P152DRAFT_454863 [Eremomyces bilateralis CBS 781.70]